MSRDEPESTNPSRYLLPSDAPPTTRLEQGPAQVISPTISMLSVCELLDKHQLPHTSTNMQTAFDHLKALLPSPPAPPLAPAPSSAPLPASAFYEQCAQMLGMDPAWFAGLPDGPVPTPSLPAHTMSSPPPTPATGPLSSPSPALGQVALPVVPLPLSPTAASHLPNSPNKAKTQSRKGKRKLPSHTGPPPKKRTKDNVQKAPVTSTEESSTSDPLRRMSRRTVVPPLSATADLLEKCIVSWLDRMRWVKMGESADEWDHILSTKFRLLLGKIAIEDPAHKVCRSLPK